MGLMKLTEKVISIDNTEKANRLEKFLDTVMFLYRDIKGRRENLSPVFVVGGVYDTKILSLKTDCNYSEET